MAEPSITETSRERRQRSGRFRFLGYAACALARLFGARGFYWGRLALNEMNVEHMVLYRFLFACVGMAPVIFLHRPQLTAGETRTILMAALFGIPIQFLLQFHGLARTTVSHASLMIGAMPVLLAAAAVLLPAKSSTGWDGSPWEARLRRGAGGFGGNRATTGRETPSLEGDLLVIASLAPRWFGFC